MLGKLLTTVPVIDDDDNNDGGIGDDDGVGDELPEEPVVLHSILALLLSLVQLVDEFVQGHGQLPCALKGRDAGVPNEHEPLSGSEKYCSIISGEEFRRKENLKQGHATAFV